MKDYNKVFDSKNIEYIKLTKKLIYEYLVMLNDMEVLGKISKNIKPISYEEEMLWINNVLNKDIKYYSMIEKQTGDYIGNVGIMRIVNNVGELGIVIKPEKQNKHYGREAIKKIIDYGHNFYGLNDYELNVIPSNKNAIHCYENVGFIEDDKTEENVHMSLKLRK